MRNTKFPPLSWCWPGHGIHGMPLEFPGSHGHSEMAPFWVPKIWMVKSPYVLTHLGWNHHIFVFLTPVLNVKSPVFEMCVSFQAAALFARGRQNSGGSRRTRRRGKCGEGKCYRGRACSFLWLKWVISIIYHNISMDYIISLLSLLVNVLRGFPYDSLKDNIVWYNM